MRQTGSDHRIDISWAACPRWATSESADLVDAVEQLGGQWVALLIDVQGSGGGGRRLASTLMHMTRESLAAGLDPATAVLATNQHLFALRQGKVGASVHACTIDPGAGCVLIAGLGKVTVATRSDQSWETAVLQGQLAGFDRDAVVESMRCPFRPGEKIVIASDGVAHGAEDLSAILDDDRNGADGVLDARNQLERAIQRDAGRPRADMAIVTVTWCHDEAEDRMLRARISIPFRRGRADV
jgi:serine phosphatase RsbU (regulator of sigma subunit)